jgi:hypothetical protein
LTNPVPGGVEETDFENVENELDAINIRIAMLRSDAVQWSLKFRGASPFLVVKDLAFTRIAFQVTGIKINPLLRELILLGLELEELFTAPPEELLAAAASGMGDAYMLAYTCATASNQTWPSASKPSRLEGSMVVATSSTVTASAR